MWAKIKNQRNIVAFTFITLMFVSSVWAVLSGFMTKETHWFTMCVWSTLFLIFWFLESKVVEQYKKLNDRMFEDFKQLGSDHITLMKENLELRADNQALLEDNNRFKNIRPIRERTND